MTVKGKEIYLEIEMLGMAVGSEATYGVLIERVTSVSVDEPLQRETFGREE